MSVPIGVGFAAIIGVMYAAAFLGKRHEEAFERWLDKWWALPTVLIFGPAFALSVGVAAALLAQQVTS